MTRYEVSMELWEDNHAFSVFSVRGETESRTVGVNLRDQGEPVDLTGKQVRVYMLTPDGSKIFSDCTLESAEEGKLSFTVSQKALEHRGLVECELWISEEPGTVLKVTGLKIHVRESVMDEEAVEASDEFSALSEALEQVKHVTDDETARIEAEIKRQESEAARIVAEAERKANETNREAAESERKTAENGRVAAEQNRVSEFATLKSESETQSSYAKEQGDYAKEQADRFKDIDVTQLQTQVEELETSVSDTENKIVALEAFKETKGQANGLASLDPSGKLSADEVPSANSMELLNLGTAELIPDNSDLNNYNTPGTYYVPASANAQTIANSPLTTSGYRLIVSDNRGNQTLNQIVIADSNIFMRYSISGTWRDWNKIAGNPTKLWSGTWSEGTITVPDIGNYTIFRITMEGMGTSILATRTSNYLRGVGGYSSATPTITYYQMGANISGTTLTFVACTAYSPTNQQTIDKIAITSIIGLM